MDYEQHGGAQILENPTSIRDIDLKEKYKKEYNELIKTVTEHKHKFELLAIPTTENGIINVQKLIFHAVYDMIQNQSKIELLSGEESISGIVLLVESEKALFLNTNIKGKTGALPVGMPINKICLKFVINSEFLVHDLHKVSNWFII